MKNITAGKLREDDLLSFFNDAYVTLVVTYDWIARYKEAIINTVATYATGTVTMTQGSDVVVGVGTTFTSAMTGRFIRANNADSYHKVTFVDPTHLTLAEAVWPYETATDVSFEVFALNYEMPIDCERLDMYPGYVLHLQERDTAWLNSVDPGRRHTAGAIPKVWVPKGVSPSTAPNPGALIVEFWPRLSTSVAIRTPYLMRARDLAVSEVPIIRSDVIETRALIGCFSRLYAEFGAEQWLTLLKEYKEDYEQVLGEALRDDQSKHALPRAVRAESGPGYDYDFMVRNDIGGWPN